MKNTQTFQVVMLPTEKATKLFLDSSDRLILDKKEDTNPEDKGTSNQHLYIISKEKPQIGDWCINYSLLYQIDDRDSLNHVFLRWKKIIATTDKSLGLPLIHDSFLSPYIKAYNEGKQIKEADLEFDNYIVKMSSNVASDGHYEGTCPQCKSYAHWMGTGGMTCDKCYVIKTRPDNTVIIHQSNTYTRQEVIDLFNKMSIDLDDKYKNFPSFGVSRWVVENL